MTDVHSETFVLSASTPVKVNTSGGVASFKLIKNAGDAVAYLASGSSTMTDPINFASALPLAPGEVIYDIPNAVNDLDTSFLWAQGAGRATRLVVIY